MIVELKNVGVANCITGGICYRQVQILNVFSCEVFLKKKKKKKKKNVQLGTGWPDPLGLKVCGCLFGYSPPQCAGPFTTYV